MAKYGVREINPLPPGYHQEPHVGYLTWTDPDLVKIERLRLLSDPGYPMWDVSYCYGRNKKGLKVRVQLPFNQLPKRGMMGALIKHANIDGVNLKALGVFDALSTLN